MKVGSWQMEDDSWKVRNERIYSVQTTFFNLHFTIQLFQRIRFDGDSSVGISTKRYDLPSNTRFARP